MNPSELPNAEAVFQKFFLPHIPDDWRGRRPSRGVLPDVVSVDGAPEAPLLDDEETRRGIVEQMSVGMIEAAEADLSEATGTHVPAGEDWLEAFDAHYDQKRVARLLKDADPEEEGNDVVIAALELSAVLGKVLRNGQSRLVWVAAWPYWDSFIADPLAKLQVFTLDWAVKRLSSDGLEDRLKEKAQAFLQVIENR